VLISSLVFPEISTTADGNSAAIENYLTSCIRSNPFEKIKAFQKRQFMCYCIAPNHAQS
jgi:hypothetical protein